MNKKLNIFLCIFFTNFLSESVLATSLGGYGANHNYGGCSSSGYVVNSNLSQALQKYCVPASMSYCTNKATYTDGKCECPRDGMYYDKVSRSCKQCEAGTYVSNRYSTECIKPECVAGSIFELVSECPSGYIKVSYP